MPAKIILKIDGMTIESGKSFELSGDPEFEILCAENDPLIPKEKILSVHDPVIFPSASVTVVEFTVA
ncbi:hypothetical protein ACFL6P_02090 [Candidatus Latescibacterota bacterium]